MTTNGINGGVHVDFDEAPTADIANGEHIRKFEDIPDIMLMEIPEIDWIVPGVIARQTMALWTGSDGAAKTFLIQKLSVAVATGGTFLGRQCQKWPVLYLDFENPSFAVRERLDLMAGGQIPGLKVWGTWLAQQPPAIGNELLLTIAKETQPLIIIDPFRYSHSSDENDSTEMMGIMQQLRYCAAAGGAVIVVHHPSKQEGSVARGSSAIKGAVDMAYLQEMSEESGLITLRCTKNRFGSRVSVTVRPDFDAGKFEVIASPEFVKQTAESEKLLQIITEEPGLTQNMWWKKSGMMKARFVSLVKANNGRMWKEEKTGNALRYFPTCSRNSEQAENNRTDPSCSQDSEQCENNRKGQAGEGLFFCSLSLGENREQPALDPTPAPVLGTASPRLRSVLGRAVLGTAAPQPKVVRPAKGEV